MKINFVSSPKIAIFAIVNRKNRFAERKRIFSLSVSVELGHFHNTIKSDNGGRMPTWNVLSVL